VLPSRAIGKNSSLPLPVPGGSEHSLACGCITRISVFVFTWPALYLSVCLCDLLHIMTTTITVNESRVHLKSGTISSKYIWLYLQRPYFQNEVIFWGSKRKWILRGVAIQHIDDRYTMNSTYCGYVTVPSPRQIPSLYILIEPGSSPSEHLFLFGVNTHHLLIPVSLH
jgi:hypothetical protein